MFLMSWFVEPSIITLYTLANRAGPKIADTISFLSCGRIPFPNLPTYLMSTCKRHLIMFSLI